MKITNHGIANTLLSTQSVNAAQGQREAGAAESTSEAGSSFIPSAELRRLLDLVRQQPEIREERVREVSMSLAQGRYLNASSAEETAAAMLADDV